MAYPDDVIADKHNLDEESLETPAKFDHWATKEAEAEDQRDLAEDARDTTKLDAELEIRTILSRPGGIEEINEIFDIQLDRYTEAAIKAVVDKHPSVVEAQLAFRQARRNWLLCMVARRSYEKKMAMLDLLTRQHGQGYFSRREGVDRKKFQIERAREALADAIDSEGTE